MPNSADAGQYTKDLRKGDRVVAIGSYESVSRGMTGTVIDVGNTYHWVLWQNGQKLPIRFNLVRRQA